MKSKKDSGQNITEFIIIIALVALVTILALTLLGNNVNKMFNSSFNKTIAYKPFNFSKTQNTSIPKGTLQSPIKECNTGNCTIDFGDFKLTNIPENFNDYVKTSGSHGGTEVLADLLDQMAEQLAVKNETVEAEKIKKLAVSGHNIAAIEAELENVAKKFNYDSNKIDNFIYNENNILPKPAGYDDTYVPFPSNLSYLYAVHNLETDFSDPNNTGDAFHAMTASFLNQLNDVNGDKQIPESIKQVVSELGWSVGRISDDVHDCIDGKDDSSVTNGKTAKDLQAYNASSISNLNSSLICAAGKHTDDGITCH